MTGLERIRRRVPFVVFVLLLVLAVMVIGFACACVSGDPVKAAERTAAPFQAVSAVIEMWSVITVVFALFALVLRQLAPQNGRASPVVTQRLLF